MSQLFAIFPLIVLMLPSMSCPTVWTKNTVDKVEMNDEITKWDIEKFNVVLQESLEDIDMTQLSASALYSQVNSAILGAAVDSIATRKRVTYPKKVKKLKHYDSQDHMLHTWRKRMRGALRASRGHDLDATKRALQRAKWPLSKLPTGLEVALFSSFTNKQDLQAALRNPIELISAHLDPKLVAQRRQDMIAASKKRSDLFEEEHGRGKGKEEHGRGKGKFLNSIFKTARKNHYLAWARNPDGSLAMTPQEVGACVTRKFESWFATVMPIEERWGAQLGECSHDKESVAWQLMLDMDTSFMDNSPRPIAPSINMGFADFVKECYQDEDVLNRVQAEGWWSNMLDPITLEEITTAVSNTTSNTAQGASKVHVNMLKKISDLSPLVTLFNKFLEDRRVPNDMNVALLRLLPKTEDGLADLDKTRPIALLETVGKLYERVIIQRVMATFASHDMLDMGQYGAMPEAGTAPPLRVLTEVLQDAHLSKSELHVIALDLRKAFDTCEHWLQALSWRAMGMPTDVVNVLVNLDAGSNNLGDRCDGLGPTTSVILDAGHASEPFTHGRGVRQGSVGGPIKWVVFMNAWLKWIKHTMRGKGYVMSSSRQRTKRWR